MQLRMTEAQDKQAEAETQFGLRITEINQLKDVIKIKENEYQQVYADFTEQSRKMRLLDGDMHRLNVRDETNAYEKKLLES
jgi:hypothetical protein